MLGFRVFLIAFFVGLMVYTSIVIGNHGANLMPIFFGDIAAMTWPGQFNCDFLGFLLLSGLWTAWRHHFTPVGLGLAVLAVFGGMSFLTVYLLTVSFRESGDINVILLGKSRAGRLSR